MNYAEDTVSDFQESRTKIRSNFSSFMALSKTSGQHQHDYVVAKMKREEIENRESSNHKNR